MSSRNNSFADYKSHHHISYEKRQMDNNKCKRQSDIFFPESYHDGHCEKAGNLLFGTLQKQLENDKMQIQICSTKMTQMESSISDFQNNQQSLHYHIKQLNQKIDALESRLHQKKSDENVQLYSEISSALQSQQDISYKLNCDTIQKTNQLFNRLYAQIHDYIGVTDENKIEEIKTRIKELLASNYDYFHQ